MLIVHSVGELNLFKRLHIVHISATGLPCSEKNACPLGPLYGRLQAEAYCEILGGAVSCEWGTPVEISKRRVLGMNKKIVYSFQLQLFRVVGETPSDILAASASPFMDTNATLIGLFKRR